MSKTLQEELKRLNVYKCINLIDCSQNDKTIFYGRINSYNCQIDCREYDNRIVNRIIDAGKFITIYIK